MVRQSRRRDAAARPAGSVARTEALFLLELIGLCGFAIAQPIFDVIGKSPETFTFHGARGGHIVLFAILVAFGPPLVLWLTLLPVRTLGERARGRAQLAFALILVSLIAFQALKEITEAGILIILPFGLVLAGLFVYLFARFPVARRWLRASSLATPAFTLMFLLASPVSELVRPASARESKDSPVENAAPVVMVVFDAFPLESLIDGSGNIDRRRHPNFARLAEDATWYRNFTAAALHTRYAVPALLTGKAPRDRSKRLTAADHPNSLFTLLADSHSMRVFEPTAMCPPSICPPPDDDDPVTEPTALVDAQAPTQQPDLQGTHPLGDILRDTARAWWDISAPYRIDRDIGAQFTEPTERFRSPEDAAEEGTVIRIPSRWAKFLRSIESSEQPALHYVHMVLPHYPWQYFPSGLRYPYDDIPRLQHDALDLSKGPVPWTSDQWPIQFARLRHLLQVQYTDRLMGTLLERLTQTELYDSSLIIVVADHGYGVGGQNKRTMKRNPSNLHHSLWVPAFIKQPGQREGTVDPRNLAAPDLLPTIADMLGIEIPWAVDGRSALDPAAHTDQIKRWNNPERPQDETVSVHAEDAWRRIRRDAWRPAISPSDESLLLYRIGPRPDLIGKPVGDLARGNPMGEIPTVDQAGSFDEIDLESGEIPAMVTGQVSSGGHGERLVAVALNGRIGGVSATFTLPDQGDGRFAVLIPETLFRQGRNDLQLFEVDGSVLRPFPGNAS